MTLAQKCHVLEMPILILVVGAAIQSILMAILFKGPEQLFYTCFNGCKQKNSSKRSTSKPVPDDDSIDLEEIELDIMNGDVGAEQGVMKPENSKSVTKNSSSIRLESSQTVIATTIAEVFQKPEETSCQSYAVKQIIAIILVLCTIAQTIIDILVFVNSVHETLADEPERHWLRYQCYALVVTNSPNLKAVLLIFCVRRLYESSQDKIYGFQIINSVMVQIYSTVWLPVLFSHLIPMFFTYIWVHIIGLIAGLLLWVAVMSLLQKCVRKDSEIIGLLGLVIVAVFFVPFLVVGVSAQAELYTGAGYIDSLAHGIDTHLGLEPTPNNTTLSIYVQRFMITWSLL